MTYRNVVQRVRVSVFVTLTSIAITTAGCFDDPTQAAEGDKSALARIAKPDWSRIPPGLAALGKLVGPWDSPDSAMTSATMDYVWDGFDLETAAIYEAPPGDQFAPQVDFHLAYNADTAIHVRLFQEYPAWAAFLDATPVEEVTPAALLAATFTQDLIDQPLDADDTIVVITAEGNCFKIGNVVENADETVTFDYEQIQCPE